MQLRKKLAVFAALALPLTGFAILGGAGVAAASSPVLTCGTLAPDPAGIGAITFNEGGTGIYLNSNAGQAAELLDAASAGATSITINKLAITGQTFTLAAFASGGPYTVTGDAAPGSGVESPDVVTFTPALSGGTLAKAKAAVTVNPTSGANNTTLFASGVTENMDVQVTNCTSSFGSILGVFSPTQAVINGTSSITNAATGLEVNPGTLTATITWPTIGADYTQPVSTSLVFSTAKDDTLSLTLPDPFSIHYTGGHVVGDYASSKAVLPLNALDAMTVCTQGELEAALLGTGPDTGVISEGANPLVVCDGGTAEAYNSTAEGGGLGEILTAETSTNSSAANNGADGTPVVAIWAIQVDTEGNVIL
jgi:hypothetical protein